jgi:hypothetical protein
MTWNMIMNFHYVQMLKHDEANIYQTILSGERGDKLTDHKLNTLHVMYTSS